MPHFEQAVWAGWGHASENPKLPELLNKAGISFLGKTHYELLLSNIHCFPRCVRSHHSLAAPLSGPSSKAMWALGDKVASSIVAQTADIPTLPWSGSGDASCTIVCGNTNCPVDALVKFIPVYQHVLFLCCHGAAGLRVDWAVEDQRQDNIISVPPEVYAKGCVQDVDDGLTVSHHNNFYTFACFSSEVIPFKCLKLPCALCGVSLQGAETIGYPVVIKASEGGGGKGIRKVESSEDFPASFRQVYLNTFLQAGARVCLFIIQLFFHSSS